MIPRSLLFCPGDRPERLTKAVTLADAVIADLEDAVLPASKASARAAVAAWLHAYPRQAERVWVRINGEPDLRDADLAALAGLTMAGIVVPKAEPPTLTAVAERVSVPLLALVETATGLWQLPEIARTPRLHTIALGEYDLAADLGAERPDIDAAPLAWARAQVVAICAATGLAAPPAAVTARLDDPAGFAEQTRALQRHGFFGRMCIHPEQVRLTHEAIRPTPDEVAAAEAVLDAAAAAERDGSGVVVVDGRLVDHAVVRRARRVRDAAALESSKTALREGAIP